MGAGDAVVSRRVDRRRHERDPAQHHRRAPARPAARTEVIRTGLQTEIDAILDLWGEAGLGIRPGDAPGSLESLLQHDPESHKSRIATISVWSPVRITSVHAAGRA